MAQKIYGASSIVYTTLADKKLRQIESLGISHYPICIAKTQYSFSSDPKAYGVAKDFELKVRDVIINNPRRQPLKSMLIFIVLYLKIISFPMR